VSPRTPVVRALHPAERQIEQRDGGEPEHTGDYQEHEPADRGDLDPQCGNRDRDGQRSRDQRNKPEAGARRQRPPPAPSRAMPHVPELA
jgi:hypothetical protein